MPRPGKGARLWLRPARRKNGRVIANAVWIIRDGGRDYATGVIARSADKKPPPEAERALAKHIADKYTPQRTQRQLEEIDIADVLAIYLDDRGNAQADQVELERRIGRVRIFINVENVANVRQTKWNPLVRPFRAVDGRWTVDAWAPVDGRVLNGGVRVAF